MAKMTMSYETEKKMSEGKGGGGSFVSELYRALPLVDGKSAINKILVLLYEPWRWGLFNPTQEFAAKYNLAFNNGGLVCVPNELCTFFFQVPSHGIENFRRPDGSEGFTYVLCPKNFNIYLTGHNWSPLFLDDSCPCCDEEQRYWEIFNDRWLELGYDREARKKLSRDQYRSIIEGDSILKTSRKSATDLKASDRTILSVFDHDKFVGERKLDEGQTAVAHQLWIAPQTVFKGVSVVYESGVQFFDTESSDGVAFLSVSKDNTRGRQRSEYSVVYSGKRHIYSPEWLAYLDNMEARVDPSQFIHLATPDEMRYYLGETPQPQTQQAAPPATAPPAQSPPPATAPPAQSPPPAAAPPAQSPPPAAAPPAQSPPPAATPPPPAAPPQAAAPPSPVPPQAAPAAPPAAPPTSPVPQAGPSPVPPQAPPAGPPAVAPPPAAGPPAGPPPSRMAPPGSPPPGRRNW